jgi:thiamine pyrophosphate-dependent acetolactate synthase large subunit-like protein
LTVAAGAAHAAAIANAIKSSGVVVKLEPRDFMEIVNRAENPLIVVGQGGVFKKHLQYLTSYKGLAFFTTSPTPLMFPSRLEIVRAKTISVPD